MGDIQFYRGFYVKGRVVDQTGNPVERLSVGFADMCLPVGMKPPFRASHTELGGHLAVGSITPVHRDMHAHARRIREGGVDFIIRVCGKDAPQDRAGDPVWLAKKPVH